MKRNMILQGDALAGLRTLPDESVDMCMTSPPYWQQRDYETDPLIWDGDPRCQHDWKHTSTRMHNGRGDAQKGAKYSEQEPIPDKIVSHATCLRCRAWKGSLGLEPTPDLYIAHLCDIFDQVSRVLKPDGTCWVNLGDCYGGQFGEPNASKLSEGRNGQDASAARVKERLPAKGLVQIPARFQIEMVNRGWILRNEIIWYKPNCMPSSAKDRFTIDFEKLFFFTKSGRYSFNQQFEQLSAAYLKRCEAVRRNNEAYDPARHKTDKSGMAQSGMEILVRSAKKGVNPRGRNMRAV